MVNTATEPALLAPVIAHRGASGLAPENTLAALTLAADQGAQCVEIDVSISADGVPFVHHDDKLDRCTNGSGYLCDHDAATLDTLSADKGMSRFAGEPLPRLTAVIDLLLARDLGLNLEIKPKSGLEQPTTEAICQIIKSHWPADANLVFSSFARDTLDYARQLLPDVPRALITGGVPKNWQHELDALQLRNFHCDANRIEKQDVNALQAAGLGVYCYTVNDVAKAKDLWRMGVNGVFSDFPRDMLEALLEADSPH